MRRRLGTIDLDTGEIVDGVSVLVGSKSAFTQLYGRRFFAVSQDAAIKLATDPDLHGETYKVLLYLCSRLDFENFIQTPQIEIVEALKMDKANVSKAIKILTEKGILTRGPKVGHSYAFRLNPNYGYKGNPKGKVYKTPLGDLRLIEEHRGQVPPQDWIKETFTLPREEARQAVQTYRKQYPKSAYQTEIDHWQELPDNRIEVTMRRLKPTASQNNEKNPENSDGPQKLPPETREL